MVSHSFYPSFRWPETYSKGKFTFYRSFLCQAPAALLCVVIAARRIPCCNSSDAKSDSQEGHGNRLRQLDFLGFSFLVVFIGCLLFVLQAVGESNEQDRVLMASLTSICVVSGLAFVLVELRTKKLPLVPFSMMKNGIGKICIGQGLLSFCHFGVRADWTKSPSNTCSRSWPSV